MAGQLAPFPGCCGSAIRKAPHCTTDSPTFTQSPVFSKHFFWISIVLHLVPLFHAGPTAFDFISVGLQFFKPKVPTIKVFCNCACIACGSRFPRFNEEKRPESLPASAFLLCNQQGRSQIGCFVHKNTHMNHFIKEFCFVNHKGTSNLFDAHNFRISLFMRPTPSENLIDLLNFATQLTQQVLNDARVGV